MTRALEPEEDVPQAEFERRLFASAQADDPPPGATERAWLQFAASAGTLAQHAVAPTAAGWWRGARAQALKWTLLGAVGGGSLVALWLGPAPAPGRLPSAPGAPPEVAAVAALVRPAPIRTAVPAPLASSPAANPVVDRATTASVLQPRVAASAPSVSARRQRAAPSHGRAAVPESTPSESLLAREVAAIDAARSALAVGANSSALRQIEQYHREFPAGELSAEADVVAIEALAAEGDRTAARRAVQAFLVRHPHDPHVARVRELGR